MIGADGGGRPAGHGEEILDISVAASDGAGDEVEEIQFEIGEAQMGGGQETQMDLRIEQEAAFLDFVPAGFEVGFKEDHAVGGRGQEGKDRRDNFQNRNKRDVHDQEADRFRDIFRGEGPGVGAFEEDNVRTVPQFGVELAVSDIDGVDSGRAAIEEDLSKPAAARADVQADFAGAGDLKPLKGRRQFFRAAADPLRPRFDPDFGVGIDRMAGLVASESLDLDLAGEDRGLGFGAGFEKSALNEDLVKPRFLDGGYLIRSMMYFASSSSGARRSEGNGSSAALALMHRSWAFSIAPLRPSIFG